MKIYILIAFICFSKIACLGVPSILLKNGEDLLEFGNSPPGLNQVVSAYGEPDFVSFQKEFPIRNSLENYSVVGYSHLGLVFRYLKEGKYEVPLLYDIVILDEDADLSNHIQMSKSSISVSIRVDDRVFPSSVLTSLDAGALVHEVEGLSFWQTLTPRMVDSIETEIGFPLPAEILFQPEWDNRKAVSVYLEDLQWRIDSIYDNSGERIALRLKFYEMGTESLYDKQKRISQIINSRY